MRKRETAGKLIKTYLIGTLSTLFGSALLIWLLYFCRPVLAPQILLPLLWVILALTILIQPLFFVMFLFMKTEGDSKLAVAKAFFLVLTSLLMFLMYISREAILLFALGGISVH